MIKKEENQTSAASDQEIKIPVNSQLSDESDKMFPRRFYNASFITECGKLEVLRAERYNKNFSIILTHIEGFHHLKQKLEKDELVDFLKRLVNSMMEVLRNCDVVGMVEEKKLVAILPETDYIGSSVAIRKLKKALENITTKGEPYASIIFSNVTYPRDGRGYGELLSTAEQRVSEQKSGVWFKFGFEDKQFWEIVSTLIEGKGYEEKDICYFDLGKGLELPLYYLDRLQEMIVREIVRDPNKKGVLYIGIGAKKILPELQILKAIEAIGITMTKIFIVGAAGGEMVDISNAVPLYLTDRRLLDTFFIFFLREDFSYAIVCKERMDEQYACFHTTDPYLIEGLIGRFREDYSLQEEI